MNSLYFITSAPMTIDGENFNSTVALEVHQTRVGAESVIERMRSEVSRKPITLEDSRHQFPSDWTDEEILREIELVNELLRNVVVREVPVSGLYDFFLEIGLVNVDLFESVYIPPLVQFASQVVPEGEMGQFSLMSDLYKADEVLTAMVVNKADIKDISYHAGGSPSVN